MHVTNRVRSSPPGLAFLRLLAILIIFGLVLPRLLGAVADYLFPPAAPGTPGIAEPTLSQTIVSERATYWHWLSDLMTWWHGDRRDVE